MPGYDFNDAAEQRDFGQLIPDGTHVKLKLNIKRGGGTVPGGEQMDAGLFKVAKPPSDAMMLDLDFVVLHGPHAKQHVFQLFTVEGGSRDDKGASKAGNITKTNIRAILESAQGIDPKDQSAEAKAKRSLRGLSDLAGIEFAARLGVEVGQPKGDGSYYNDKNKIDHIVTPNEPEWRAIMAGEDVAAKPSNFTPRSGTAAAAASNKPAWQQAATPAPAVAQQQPLWATAPAANGAAPAATAQPAAQPAAANETAPAAGGPAWMNG